ncbi:MAG: hypothetical protein II695_07120 [Oscillospiraceae bacterium]|nr:hypothetical protein [Oscillospiraceae bacterium]
MKKAAEIAENAVLAILNGIVTVFDFISDLITPNDPLMKVTNPFTRQSFAENVRNSGKKN